MPGGEKMTGFTRILHRVKADECMDEVSVRAMWEVGEDDRLHPHPAPRQGGRVHGQGVGRSVGSEKYWGKAEPLPTPCHGR